MKRGGPVSIAVLLATLVGCYSNVVEPSPPPNPSASATARPAGPTASPTFEPIGTLVVPVAAADELLYYRGRVPFPLSVLAGPGADELANHPAADALRRSMPTIVETIGAQANGWHYLGQSQDVVEFVQWTAVQPELGGSHSYVVLKSAGATYSLDNWGGCAPRLAAPPGKVALEWLLTSTPEPGLTMLGVDVVAATCAGGPDAALIDPPTITVADDYVAIALMARYVERQTGCEKGGCGVILPTGLQIELPEPLGTRGLLDLSVFPARDATLDPFNRGCGG